MDLLYCCFYHNVWLSYHQVIRSRLQEQGQVRNSEKHYSGVIDCIEKVYRKEGLPGFYRGCATNLLRTTPSAVITFTSFEMIHRFLQRLLHPDAKHSPANPNSDGHIKPQRENGRTVVEQNDSSVRQSQAQSTSNRTPIPIGNKEQLPASHWLISVSCQPYLPHYRNFLQNWLG